MVVDRSLYDLIGVNPTVNDRDLHKAYLAKAKVFHPDKNRHDPNATAKFQALNEAYAILKDPEKRRIYDRSGPAGLADIVESQSEMDLISQLFAFAHRFRGKASKIIESIEVTLEELYTGAEKELKIEREVPCARCNGTGSKSRKKSRECIRCQGEGQVVVNGRTRDCPKCQGLGRFIPKIDRCAACKAEGTLTETKVLSIHVEPGSEDGDKISFAGQANEAPGSQAGDVVVILVEVPHAVFTRSQQDLLMVQKVTVYDALFGVKFPVAQLDGRILIVETAPGTVLTADAVKVVPGEGMPVKGDPFHKGSLYISFNVEFPVSAQLTEPLRLALAAAMPPVNRIEGIDPRDENVYTAALEDVDHEAYKEALRRAEDVKEGGEDEEEDEEDMDEETMRRCDPM
jgi:DnaJ family protein A protein 2